MERSSGYDYELTIEEQYVYRFVTNNEIRYEVKFVPSSDYFEAYLDMEAEIFEMVISVVDNPFGGRIPADGRIATTIFTIFEHFFLPQRYALVFICDSSDGREQARFRKFSNWFYQRTIHSTDLAKFDRTAIDRTTIIYLSLIVSRHHPNLIRIVEMFMQLGEEEK
ncbi:DUF6169 family protein [Spirosoma panaciterrae]|uniref:DUF6169 family protein n=1 Tax=Spirosoma panaciterrae TaxID=496058 RepID=UPI00035D484E|nr:DUF6169 family protein [Spirosoma panaciterrae]